MFPKLEIGKAIKKIFRGTVKSFDEATHTATIFISTGDIDRDTEVIEPKAFQKEIGNYLAHPILLSSHRSETLTRQIGEAKAIRITDQGVEGDYEWYAGKGNPEADWGWFLVTRGIAAFSVGFIPKVWMDKWSNPMISAEDSAKGINRRYTQIELLENSQVLVPANPAALQRQIGESVGEEKELCELVAKSVKAEEMAQFDPQAGNKDAWLNDPRLKDFIKSCIEENALEVQKTLPIIIEKAVSEAMKKFMPKHYSEILLEPGRNVGKQSSTEEPKVGATTVGPTVDGVSIVAAVKEATKESAK